MYWVYIIWELVKEFKHFLLEVIPLAIIAYYLHRAKSQLSETVQDLGEKIETLKQQVNATQEMAEAALARPTNGTNNGSAENWEAVRRIWQKTRNRIELAIEDISRKNTREKYSRFTRYRYSGIVKALERDRVIDQKLSILLQSMELQFLGLRRQPSTTSAVDVQKFVDWDHNIGTSLPIAEEDVAKVVDTVGNS